MYDYADENGSRGSYDSELKIYGRKNVSRTKTADGRITYWDSEVQK